MMRFSLIWTTALTAIMLALTACSDSSDEEEIQDEVEAPSLLTTIPADGTTDIPVGDLTISLTYDRNISLASGSLSRITLTGGTVVSANVAGVSSTLTVNVNVLTYSTVCTLTIPEGVVCGPGNTAAPAVSLQFTTEEEPEPEPEPEPETEVELVTPNASAEAKAVFNFLYKNYGSKILSATMAKDGVNGVTSAWNNAGAEDVYAWTGKYPAINCYDYNHLDASPANWIDYNDITPVSNWWKAGGLVAAMWHWVVPVSEEATNISFSASDTEFDPAKATVAGTWENRVFTTDLAEAADYLKLLRDAGIPVIWRPFHEAAGGWFWWGKDAESFKAMWKAMFDYFQQQGLNNLIWVWTTEMNDANWYPGDEYVDMIGRDLYGNMANDCATQFNTISTAYPDKMVALSECGYNSYNNSRIGRISQQWSAGARWSWFMPWYDADNATTFHNSQVWWQDAMSQDYVISRKDVKL